MGAATHLGIKLTEYDRRIRTFIPHYEAILAAAATTLAAVARPRPVVVDLGTGSGALASRVQAACPSARITGIDSDAGMLGLARRRLRGRIAMVEADFLSVELPRCDAITASFALHHIPTRRRKSALYAKYRAALRPGGVLVNADCTVASDAALREVDRQAWLAHLQRTYSRRRAEGFLRAWAREDVYFQLDDEVAMMRAAGFTVDVAWRRDSFAVVVGTR